MAEQNPKLFVDGMRFEAPHMKAPAWVKGKISIQAEKLIPFIEAHKNEKGWLNIDIKQSKGGKLYCELNTWQKGQHTGNRKMDEAQEAQEQEQDMEMPQL